MIVVAVGVYFTFARLLRCEELPEVWLLLRRREPVDVTAAALEP